MEDKITADIYGMMQSGEPYKTYKKTILGKATVRIIDPFQDKPTSVILEGRPNDPSAEKNFIELWSEKELVYFVRANRKHLDNGVLVEHTKPRETEVKKTVNNMSEDEVNELVVAPFPKLKSVVGQITSETALQRILLAAEVADRPVKTMEFLQESLSLLQSGEVDANRDSN